MTESRPSRRLLPLLSRRSLALGALSGALPLAAPRIGSGQTLERIVFTLPWVPQGSSAFLNVAKAKGFWRQRGLDVDLPRGFGSTPTAIAVGEGRFQFGTSLSSAVVLAAARNVPIASIGIVNYSSSLGIAVAADGPIRTPRDLEGRVIGGVLNSGEAPFREVMAQRGGFDLTKTTVNSLDIAVLEQSLMQRRVDAIFCVGPSSLPPLLSAGFRPRFFPGRTMGVDLYGQVFITQQRMVETNPDLCKRVVDGALEGLAYTLNNPEEALQIFLREYPEVAMTRNGNEFTKLGLQIWMNEFAPEARTHGLGYADEKALNEGIDLVMRYVAPAGLTRPDPARLFTNRFVGGVKLSPEQWAAADRWSEPMRGLILGRP